MIYQKSMETVGSLVNRCCAGPSGISFMLKGEGCHLYGHNLDSGCPVPGLVVINKRGITKESRTWKELTTGEKDGSISFQWTSKFGSVTFNPFGREFPDGGMNEAGLIVQEMSLLDTEFPDGEGKRKMFMMLWMQYVLDCFETVEQVIQSASETVLDGWGWHFFTADKHGGHASIESFSLGCIPRRLRRYKKESSSTGYPVRLRRGSSFSGCHPGAKRSVCFLGAQSRNLLEKSIAKRCQIQKGDSSESQRIFKE